jgi:hypothetical protein
VASVRQHVDNAGKVQLSKVYEPFGEKPDSIRGATSSYREDRS